MKNLRQVILGTVILFVHIALFAQSKLSVTISNPTDVHLCIESDELSIEVRNITTSTVSGIETEVSMPTGVTYVAGSLNSTGVTEKNITDLSKPVFSVSSLGLAQAATIRIKLNIDCSISAFLNNGGLAVVRTTTIYTGGSVAKNSSPLNVKQPSLQIQGITNQFKTVTRVGEIFTRQITLKNSGSGKLSSLSLRRTVQNGLVLLSAGGSNVTQSGDTTITTLDSSDFKSIGNNDIYLDLNETISLLDSIKVISCSNLSASFWADWGCNSEICRVTSASANVTISSINPSLIISSQSSTTTCLENGTTHPQQIVLFNSGSDTARDVDLYVFQAYSLGFYQYMMSEIEINSFSYQTSLAGVHKAIYPYKTINTVNTGIYSCLSNNPVGRANLLLPDLAPGDSLIVHFLTRSCTPTACSGGTFYNQRWKFEVTTYNQCQKEIKSGEIWGSYGNYNSMIFSKFVPTDVLDGERVRLEYSLSNGYLLSPSSSSQFKVELILPQGLTHTKTTADLKFLHANGSYWIPTYFTQNGDTITAYFNGTPTVTLPRSELLIDLLGDCNGLSSNSSLTYQVNISYSPDTTCSRDNSFPIYCVSDDLKLHCAPSCNAGLHFNDFKAERISYGLPDNNNDGLPDAYSNLDFDKIKTNRIMYGDTLKTTFRAKVYNAGSITNWNHGKAISTLDWGYYLKVADVRIKIYRVGNLLFNCNNINYSSTTSGYAKTFTFDIGYTNLINSGCSIYSSFAYLNVDSIELEVTYVVDKNPGNAIRDLNITNDFYLSSVANPSSSQKFQCDSFSARLSLIGYYFTNYGKNVITQEGCGTIALSQNYYLSVGQCCTNYAGGNIFPYEYRPWAKLSEIIFEKPDGFDVLYSRFIQYRTFGTGGTRSQILDTIKPYAIAPNELKYKTDTLYEDQGGDFIISDDGFHGTFTTYLSPNCKAEDKSNYFDYSFVFQQLNGLGNSLDTIEALSQRDIIEYSKPKVDVVVKNSYVYAETDTVEWDIRLVNTSTSASAENVWIGSIANGNAQIVDIVDLTSGNSLQATADIFKLGNLTKLAQKDYRVKAIYQSCNIDSIEMQTAYDCAGYPDSIADYECSTLKTKLYFEPINTRLEASLFDTAVSVNLCENKEYTVQIRNTGSPKVYDSYLDILLRPGMILGDTAWLYIDGRTDSIYIPSPSSIAANTYRWEFATTDSNFINSGLQGVKSADGYTMTLKFKLTTDCDFTSGSFFLIKPGGYLKCGDPVNAAFTVGDPIEITGVSKPYFSATSFDMSHIDACNYVDSSYIKFINLGPDTTGLTDKIIISFPAGILADTSFVDTDHNSPLSGPTYNPLNGENTYSWQLPSGIAAGDSSIFRVKTLLDNNNLSCGVKQIFAQAVITQPVMCVLDSSFCDIKVATSSVLVTDSVEKGVYQLGFLSASSLPVNSDEDVNLRYTVSNSGSLKSDGSLLLVDIVFDQNQNGIVDSSDVIITQDSIFTEITNGQTISRSVDFTIASSYTCNLLISLGPDNCLCDPSFISVPTVQLINAGEDTLVCPNVQISIGQLGSSTNTYQWNNASLIDNPDSSITNFIGVNTTTNIDTALMILTTNKGNCSSKDTVVISLYPGMKINMADTAKVCKYDKALIGEVVQGGTGRVKQYQWSPTDSLSNATAVRTYANPLQSTKYRIEVTDNVGCLLLDSIYVDVLDKPTADFSVVDSCAFTNFKFIDQSNYNGYTPDSIHWQSAPDISTNVRNPIYRLDSAGVFSMKLYINNSYGCWDTITKEYEVYPIPVPIIDAYADCEGDTTTVQSLSTIAAGSFTNNWLIEGISYSQDAVVISLPNKTEIPIQLEVTSDKGCKASTIDTLEIWDKPDISIDPANVCLNDSVNFKVDLGTGNIEPLTNYNWTLGDGSSSTIDEFNYAYSDSGTYQVQVVVANSYGCSDTATGGLSIYSLPQSLFIVQNACLGDSNVFEDISNVNHGTISQWLWDLGNGYVNGSDKIKHIVNANGTYQITQKIISSFGCMDSSTQSYDVYYKEKPALTINGNCENELIDLFSIPQYSDSVSAIYWIIGSDTLNTSNISYLFGTAGDFDVQQIVETNRGCVSDSVFTVHVDSKPNAQFTVDQFCNDNQVEFSSSGSQLEWDLGDGTQSNLTRFIHQYPARANYTVQLIETNQFGCKDTVVEEVLIENIVVPAFEIRDVCEEESQWVINNTAGNGTPITSSEFDMGNGDVVNSTDSFEYRYTVAGTYNVVLTITTTAGCTYDTAQLVVVHPLPVADFDISPSTADIFTAHISISDQSSGSDSMIYIISDGSTYTTSDFEYDFLDSGRYVIKQWVGTQFGCMDSMTKDIYIQFAYKLFIPNAFSPNNDKINDEFKPIGFGMESFEMSIYNRWGELVFQSEAPNQAWDGRDAIPGYYMYQIKAWDFQKGVHHYKGGVYLLR